MSYIAILITFIFINNFILVQFLGLCPFIGVSKDSENAIGMGAGVTFVTTVASVVTWAIYHFLLVPFDLAYLETLSVHSGDRHPGSAFGDGHSEGEPRPL